MPARQPDLKEERKGPRVGAPDRRDRRLPQGRGPRLDRRGHDPEGPQEGRLLRRADREAGPAGDRGDRRDAAGGRAHLPVAEVDALGRAVGNPAASNGCAAARDRRDLRAGDRGARDRARSRSAASRPATTTYGHRFLAPGAIKVRRFDDYVAKLEKAKVVLDPARRSEIILRRRQEPRLRARLRTGRGRGPAERGRRAWSNGRSC